MARITRGMRERRSVDPRVLQLKMRVRAPAGTTREQLLAVIEDAAETGILAPGFTVHYIDWRKGEGSGELSGHISMDAAGELRNFYLALTNPSTRVRVEQVD